MNFFKKPDRATKPTMGGGRGSLEGKPMLGDEAGASGMVRKPARTSGAAPGAAGGKRFEKMARGAVTGDLAEALEEVQGALEEQPTNDDLHMRRYEVLKRVGDKTLLASALEESCEATQRSFYGVKLAALCEENEDFPAALRWRRRVVEMNPEDPDAQKKLAIAFVRSRDLEGAQPAYERLIVLKKDVDNPLGTSFLDDMTGRGLAPEDRTALQDMGLNILDLALEARPTSAALLEIAARLAARAARHDEATGYYERLLKAHPDHASIRVWKGELLRVLARAGVPEKWKTLSDELIRNYQEHLRAQRGDVRSWITLARLQMEAGLSDDALASFKSAIRADSREWQAVYEHGKLLVRLGRSDEAIQWYEDILSPFSSEAPEKKSIRRALERSLAELYFKLGRYSESLAIYVREEEANLRFIAPIYEAAADLARAEELYRKSLQQSPKDAKAHLALAEYWVRRGNWEQVELVSRAGLTCSNAYDEVLEGLYVAIATAQMNKRLVNDALATMEEAVKESPDSASMLFRKVKLMILAKQVKEGRGLAEHVRDTLIRRLACAPAHSGYWSLLGDVHSLLGKPDEAEKAYRQAVRFDAQDAPAVRGLGVLAERKQDFRNALELYRRFVVLDPLNLASLPIRQKIDEIAAALGQVTGGAAAPKA